jgi:hypothetical protein
MVSHAAKKLGNANHWLRIGQIALAADAVDRMPRRRRRMAAITVGSLGSRLK